jgi:hypothetical protein
VVNPSYDPLDDEIPIDDRGIDRIPDDVDVLVHYRLCGNAKPMADIFLESLENTDGAWLRDEFEAGGFGDPGFWLFPYTLQHVYRL